MASALSFPPWVAERGAFDPDKQKWELYNIDDDFTQANDLAAQNPDKLRQMQDLWWIEASKYNVLPLDWRGSNPRFNAELMGRPSLIGKRKTMTYYPGTFGLPDAAAPPMLNKSWTITAELELSDSNTNGIIITHGGMQAGYGLYLKDSKPVFVYNYLALDWIYFNAKEALPKGKTKLIVDFLYDGGGLGKGGKISMSANGKKIAEGRLEKTVPVQFSIVEGMDIGKDVGSPVDWNYKMPFEFTGKIEKVTVDLK
ncbi:hypothetical protein AAEO57_00230 [Flavobacterium sp. DGU38]|uniref:Arylsulfatase n=1 Tax=Flavobacterium calami TaxID=3139144 RepID=A0ABU9IIF0_9FLAO